MRRIAWVAVAVGLHCLTGACSSEPGTPGPPFASGGGSAGEGLAGAVSGAAGESGGGQSTEGAGGTGGAGGEVGGTAGLAGNSGSAGTAASCASGAGGSSGSAGGAGVGVSGVGGAGMGGSTFGGSAGSSGALACPEISVCATEPSCAAALLFRCGECDYGSFGCGTRGGYYFSDGTVIECARGGETFDCGDAALQANAKCEACGGIMLGNPVEDCAAAPECADATSCSINAAAIGCSVCSLNAYACGTAAGTGVGYFASDGTVFSCDPMDVASCAETAVAHCCPQ
jgi:hypothetical protein